MLAGPLRPIVAVVWNVPLSNLTDQLKAAAGQLGFILAGVTAAAAPRRLHSFYAWLDAGYAGQMHYLTDRRAAYSHPQHVLEGCRSILMLALPYAPSLPANRHASGRERDEFSGAAAIIESSPVSEPSRGHLGKVARYAQGVTDYHDVIHHRLKALRHWLLEQCPGAAVRGVVDTATLLERELAAAAGLGWIGKNTLLLNRQWGSTFFLAALLTDIELQTDIPDDHSYCGTCTACLDACPTQAFPEPFVLDATRCISYLTIEHRGAVDEALRQQLDGWVFGCDVCQDVCPWNQHAAKQQAGAVVDSEFAPRSDLQRFDVLELLSLDDEQFRLRFRRTPLWRAKRRGLLRNAILIAGTRRLPQAHELLLRLSRDNEPLIQQAATWALKQYQDNCHTDH